MHELPKDLTNSLRSYRGSTYGNSRKSAQYESRAPVDLEMGLGKEPEDYGDKEFDQALNTTQSSLILHPSRSLRHIDKPHEEQYYSSEEPEPERQNPNQMLRFESNDYGVERPRVDTKVRAAKGLVHQPQTPAKHSIYDAPPVKDPDPAADRLAEDLTPLTPEDFYDLVGLNPPTADKDGMGQLAKKHGLYSKMVRYTRYTHRKYRAFAIAVYVFLLLQLVISAVFIILGSIRNVNTHITIAVLGAVSTVIAGALALMQGQGLPNRLRQVRDSLRNILFEAEELYWDMKSGRPVLYKDVKKLREDFLRVLEEQQKNRPDVWTSSARETAEGAGRPGRGKQGG